MEADIELADDQLPGGHTPIWIQAPSWNTTELEMLERVETLIVGKYQDVMVLHDSGRLLDERTFTWCQERGWKFQANMSIFGCEAECVVLLDCLILSEFITRGRNMLVIFSR